MHAELVEYRTVDGIHHVAITQHDLASPYVLTPVAADYDLAQQRGRTYTVDAAAVRTALAGQYADDVLAHEVVSSDQKTVVERLGWAQNHILWSPGITVERGAVVSFANTLWRCLQAHVTQGGWQPSTTPALWTRYYTPDVVPDWVQPISASDAWPFGAHVMHRTKEWISQIQDNVWEPGVAAGLWLEVGTPSTTEWAVGTAYAINDVVTYQGQSYKCRQAHTAQVGWEPPKVLALWLPV